MEQALMPIKTLIEKSWAIYRKNLNKFISPILLIIPGYLFVIYFEDASLWLENYLPKFIIIIGAVLLGLFSLFLALWAQVILTKIINNLHNNSNYQEKELYDQSIRLVPSYLAVSIITGLVMIGGFILLIVPFLFFMVWYNFAPLVTVLEEKDNRGLQALKLSKKLTKGRAWDVYGRMFVPALLVEILLYLILIVFGLILVLIGLPWETALLIAYLLFLIATIALMPLFIAFEVILYNNIKETRKLN